MFENYLKIAWRNITKNKVFSAINVIGLSIGLSCVILLNLFIKNEMTYDSFHKNIDRMYRVYISINNKDGSLDWNLHGMTRPNAPAMKEYFSEIQYITRFENRDFSVKYNEKIFNESISLVDAPFFEMFTFPLISGDPKTALAQQNSIVLTEELAQKYFGSENPIGKTLTLFRGDYANDFNVTGIAEKPPSNSTVTFEMAADIGCLRQFGESRVLDNWNSFSGPNYLVLKKAEFYDRVKNRLPAFAKQYYSAMIESWSKERGDNPISFGLQKMKEVHLDSSISGSPKLDLILLLSGLVLTILIIACINFITLSISRASLRAVEIGMRKTLGASRRQLVQQFWSESILITVIAMTIGVVIACLLLPSFNFLSKKELSINNLLNIPNILILLLLTVIIGVLSGSYPAFIISRFKLTTILKGKLKLGEKNYLKRSMVIFQFVLSIFLITSTMIMRQQTKHVLNKDLGYNKNGVVLVDIQETDAESSHRIFSRLKEKLNQHKNVLNMSASDGSFGIFFPMTIYRNENTRFDYYYANVDYDIFKTLDLEIVEGRVFSKEFSTDTSAVIISQKFAERLELQKPVGKQLRILKSKFTIIGIVKDFNIGSLKDDMTPTLFYMAKSRKLRNCLVRITAQNMPETIEMMGKTWNEIQPDKPFVFSFLDDRLKAQYDNEKRWEMIARFSSAFAVLITCMGIFGLTSITIHHKIKEIGIRKVLGAKAHQIMGLILKELVLLVAIANIIAWPFAFYFMNKWLQNFAYHIDLTIWSFLLAGFSTLLMALITVSYKTVKTANSNPVDSLRYE